MSFLKKNKRRLLGLGVFVLAFSGIFIFVLRVVAGPKEASLLVRSTETAAAQEAKQTFKVMTLNLAHGRLDGPHQILLSRDQIQDNLESVAKVVRRESPFILGVQEADDVSWWSSRENHVQLLAEKIAPVNFVQGHHIAGMGLKYGTAILGRGPMKNGYSYRFGYSPPTLLKGFVISEVTLGPGRTVWFVSVHLDFLRSKVRARQMDRMAAILKSKPGAKIVVGDFNCEWVEGGMLQRFTETLELKAFQPERDDLSTFPTFSKRIDWILVSEEFDFESYEVLEDTISDHRAVTAELRDRRKP
ncbi:MAG: endonuclease/exonuclease/phosphatase family protein [Planctomycetota bacterium]|nr:endonuclease/exonuclease/phosphatase family protein [Planctomycetota bacterium]